MQKEEIKENFNVLEERLDRLQAIALHNEVYSVASEANFDFEQTRWIEEIRAQVSALHSAVSEEVLKQKSISAIDLVTKVSKFVIEETQKKDIDISISSFGKGQVSLLMLESAMAAILACARVAISSVNASDYLARQEKGLFGTSSFSITLISSDEGMHFTIQDDGIGYADQNFNTDFSSLREYVAKQGGWFQAITNKTYGGKIEFRIPLPRLRVESHLLSAGSFILGIPASCVTQILENPVLENERLYVIHPQVGLMPLHSLAEAPACTSAVRIAVADFQFVVACEKIEQSIAVRKLKEGDLLEENSWFHFFGVYQKEGLSHLIPYIEGQSLMDLYHRDWSRP